MAIISIEIPDADLDTARNIIGQINDAIASAKPAKEEEPPVEDLGPDGGGKKNPMGGLADFGAELAAGDKLIRP